MSVPNSKTVEIENYKHYNEWVKTHKTIEKCSKFPQSSIGIVEKIVAVGDIHGDFDVLLGSLFSGGVINQKGKWVGGNTVVVQVGDILDKGGRGRDDGLELDDSEWRIICYLEQLQKQASQDGGLVSLLIGNHEIMNLKGDFRYTTQATLDYFGGEEGRREAFKPGGPIFQKLACMMNGIVKVGSWVFVHAGLIPETLADYDKEDGLEQLNGDLRNYFLGNIDKNDNKWETINNLFQNNDGFIWTREFGNDNVDCGLLEEALSMELVKNDDGSSAGGLVVGHTPKMYENINGKCNNKLYAIDRGMSSAFGDQNLKRIEVLEIVNDEPKI